MGNRKPYLTDLLLKSNERKATKLFLGFRVPGLHQTPPAVSPGAEVSPHLAGRLTDPSGYSNDDLTVLKMAVKE